MRRIGRREVCVWCAACLAAFGISACGDRSIGPAKSSETELADFGSAESAASVGEEPPAFAGEEPPEPETAFVSEKLPVDWPPELVLTDLFSSQENGFVVKAGNYRWSVWDDGTDQTGGAVIACGASPLEVNRKEAETLKVPSYNGMEGAPYQASFGIDPDSLTVSGWTVEKAGDLEAEMDVKVSYEGTWDGQILELTPDMIYQILAVWDEDQAKERGFFGEAEYLVVTQ